MSRYNKDTLLLWSLRLFAVMAGMIVVLICGFLVIESIPGVRHIRLDRFAMDPTWNPSTNASEGTFGLGPMLVGTLGATAGAVLLATPLGLLSAIFSVFYASPKFGAWYRKLVELLAGIPSVVYGFWGLVVLVPMIRTWSPPGPSLLAGILVLTVMILPTIAVVSQSSMCSIPVSEIQGAVALGFGPWATLRCVIWPRSRSGISTAILLGAGRAIGETMAILMVCGNIVRYPKSLFDPVRTLTANIALEMAYALGHHRSALFVSGLVLMSLVVILVVTVDRIQEVPPYA